MNSRCMHGFARGEEMVTGSGWWKSLCGVQWVGVMPESGPRQDLLLELGEDIPILKYKVTEGDFLMVLHMLSA